MLPSSAQAVNNRPCGCMRGGPPAPTTALSHITNAIDEWCCCLCYCISGLRMHAFEQAQPQSQQALLGVVIDVPGFQVLQQIRLRKPG